MLWMLAAVSNTAVDASHIVQFWLWWTEKHRNFGREFPN